MIAGKGQNRVDSGETASLWGAGFSVEQGRRKKSSDGSPAGLRKEWEEGQSQELRI